jgi:hypothetical protein
MRSSSDGPPLWLRVVFALNIIQDLALAVGLLWPDKIPFPLTVTPLNARFIGALYLASALGMVLSASAPRKVDTRIFVVAFGIVSILVLFVTVLYWGDFTARRVPVLWLVTYTADPILTAFALFSLRLFRAAEPGWHRLSSLLLAEFAILGLAGAVLMLAPDFGISLWPWKITALLARTYGAFFVTIAIGALLAAHERRMRAILPLLVSSLGLMAFVLLASSFHLDRFTPGLPTTLWLGGFGVGALALAWALAVALLAPGRAGLRARSSRPSAFRPS